MRNLEHLNDKKIRNHGKRTLKDMQSTITTQQMQNPFGLSKKICDYCNEFYLINANRHVCKRNKYICCMCETTFYKRYVFIKHLK